MSSPISSTETELIEKNNAISEWCNQVNDTFYENNPQIGRGLSPTVIEVQESENPNLDNDPVSGDLFLERKRYYEELTKKWEELSQQKGEEEGEQFVLEKSERPNPENISHGLVFSY